MELLEMGSAFDECVVCLAGTIQTVSYLLLAYQSHGKFHKHVNLCFAFHLCGSVFKFLCLDDPFVLGQHDFNLVFLIEISLRAADSEASTRLFKLLSQVLPASAVQVSIFRTQLDQQQ